MQATAQAKGGKPNRSGLLTVVLVFTAGLSIGALAWAGIDAYRTDSDADSVTDVAVSAPSVNLPTDRTGIGSDDQVAEAGIGAHPDVYSQPGEPNLTVDQTLQADAIETDRADWLAQREPHAGQGDGIVGGFTEVEADLPVAHFQPGMGEGIMGGFGEYAAELPTAYHQPGMGEGWVASGESVDPGIAQDPVAQPGVGYFA